MTERSAVRVQMDRVITTAAPYWAGEAEVVRAYFAQLRTFDRDLQWLRAQAYKEARPFRDLSLDLQEEFVRTGTLVHHPQGPAALLRLLQEVQHFSLLSDLLSTVSDQTMSLRDVVDLPEDRKLQELRAAYRRRGDLERAAAEFTEGGGGAMFEVLSRVGGNEFERKVAGVFRVIAADERSHGLAEITTIAHYARDEEDWGRARAIVRDISHQRLCMRNEMFGFPLSTGRIEAIENGHIIPWQLPRRS